jgi:hypothetical protein
VSVENISSPLNIHPELRTTKAHTLPTNRWALSATQILLSAVNAIHRRKFKVLFKRTTIVSSHNLPCSDLDHSTRKNQAPPLVLQAGGFSPESSNPLGRLVRLSVSKRW